MPFFNKDIYDTFTLIKVNFLSNGRVTETKTETNYNTTKIDNVHMTGLKSGGIVIGTIRFDGYGCEIIGNFLESNDRIIPDFDPKIHLDYGCLLIDVTNNNSVIAIPEVKETYWTFSTLEMPHLNNDKGYDSPIINWTAPTINDTIALKTTKIQIAYNIPIKCSFKNISIYQKLDDGKESLRETYSAQSKNCQVLSNNTTLSFAILPSTFNQPNLTYYIKVDTDFVK